MANIAVNMLDIMTDGANLEVWKAKQADQSNTNPTENEMNTTSDQDTMKNLGINPGQVSGYSDVSLEPISFMKEGDLGGRTAWCAQHSATIGDLGTTIVEVDGYTVIVDNNKSQSFNALLEAWRQHVAQVAAADHPEPDSAMDEDLYTHEEEVTLTYN